MELSPRGPTISPPLVLGQWAPPLLNFPPRDPLSIHRTANAVPLELLDVVTVLTWHVLQCSPIEVQRSGVKEVSDPLSSPAPPHHPLGTPRRTWYSTQNLLIEFEPVAETVQD